MAARERSPLPATYSSKWYSDTRNDSTSPPKLRAHVISGGPAGVLEAVSRWGLHSHWPLGAARSLRESYLATAGFLQPATANFVNGYRDQLSHTGANRQTGNPGQCCASIACGIREPDSRMGTSSPTRPSGAPSADNTQGRAVPALTTQ